MYMTPCQCQNAGWCERHKVEKNRFEFERCRRIQKDFEAWEGGTMKQPPIPLTCSHRGQVTRQIACNSCRGQVAVKVFACAVHGECTMLKKREELCGCQDCTDRA